jgi:peptidyl-prolyl cis-trans isomerase D
MLKAMRDSFHHLKWTLFAVIIVFVLGFVFVSGTGTGNENPATRTVAEVSGKNISALEFDRMYREQVERYRSMYGGNFTPQLARTLDLPRQVLEGMVDRQLRLEGARRLKLRVSDEELSRHVTSLPVFQENGKFIGREKYERLLRNNGMTAVRFEEGYREDLLLQKYDAAIREGVVVTDADIRREFDVRNDKATIEYMFVPAARLEAAVEPSEAELKAFFEKDRERFKAPIQRQFKYLLVDREKVRGKVPIAEPEARAEYEKRKAQFAVPETYLVSHILFRSEPDAPPGIAAAVETKALSVLARARAGEDFAKLADEFTEDPSGKGQGGRLPPYPAGQMVPEFDQAVAKMSPGEIAGPVKTQFGYHLIQFHSKSPARTRDFAEVRPALEAELSSTRATAEAERIAKELAEKARKDSSDEGLRKLQSDTTSFNVAPWSARGQAIEGLGAGAELMEQAWTLKVGEIARTPVSSPRGFVVLKVAEERAAGVPPFEEIRAQVAEQWKQERRRKDALDALAPAARELADGGSLAAIAKRYETEVKTTPEFAPGGPIPEVGNAPELSKAVFATAQGEAGPPVPIPGGYALFRVIQRKAPEASLFEAQKTEIAESLRRKEADRLIRAYLQARRVEAGVRIDDAFLQEYLPDEPTGGRS